MGAEGFKGIEGTGAEGTGVGGTDAGTEGDGVGASSVCLATGGRSSSGILATAWSSSDPGGGR